MAGGRRETKTETETEQTRDYTSVLAILDRHPLGWESYEARSRKAKLVEQSPMTPPQSCHSQSRIGRGEGGRTNQVQRRQIEPHFRFRSSGDGRRGRWGTNRRGNGESQRAWPSGGVQWSIVAAITHLRQLRQLQAWTAQLAWWHAGQANQPVKSVGVSSTRTREHARTH